MATAVAASPPRRRGSDTSGSVPRASPALSDSPSPPPTGDDAAPELPPPVAVGSGGDGLSGPAGPSSTSKSPARTHTGPRRRRRTARGRYRSRSGDSSDAGFSGDTRSDGGFTSDSSVGTGADSVGADGGSPGSPRTDRAKAAQGKLKLKLADFLEKRPTIERLKQRNIIREPSWDETRRQSARYLETHLTSRPHADQLVDMNLVAAGAVAGGARGGAAGTAGAAAAAAAGKVDSATAAAAVGVGASVAATALPVSSAASAALASAASAGSGAGGSGGGTGAGAGKTRTHLDGRLASAHRKLERQLNVDTLSRSLKNRQTPEQLMNRNILHELPARAPGGATLASAGAGHGGGGDEDGGDESPRSRPSTHRVRALRGRAVEEALMKRPSVSALMQSNLIKSVMMWTKLDIGDNSDVVVAERNCHTTTLVGRRIFVLGGFSTTRRLTAQPCVLDIDQNKWVKWRVCGPQPWPVYGHTAVTVGKGRRIFAFGGYNSDHRWLSAAFLLDTHKKRWITIVPADHESSAAAVAAKPGDPTAAASAGGVDQACPHDILPVTGQWPTPRAAHSCVVDGNKAIIFAGNDGLGLFNDVHVFDTDRCHWSPVETAGSAPPPRTGHGAALLNHRMFVFGGTTGLGGDAYNDLYVLDCETWAWYRPSFTGTPPVPCGGHSVTMVGHKMFVFGGNDNIRAFNNVHILDTDVMAWSRPSDAGSVPSVRAGHSGTAVGSSLLVFGGGSPEGRCFNECYVLDTAYDFYPDAQDLPTTPTRSAGEARVTWADDVESAARDAPVAASAESALTMATGVSASDVGEPGVPGPKVPASHTVSGGGDESKDAGHDDEAARAAVPPAAGSAAIAAGSTAAGTTAAAGSAAKADTAATRRGSAEIVPGRRWADVAAVAAGEGGARAPAIRIPASSTAVAGAAARASRSAAASSSVLAAALGAAADASTVDSSSGTPVASPVGAAVGSGALDAVLSELQSLTSAVESREASEEAEWAAFMAAAEARRNKRKAEADATLRRIADLRAALLVSNERE